ncbi:hypothetical protein [Clostridium sp.]|uniref:hypothetical protein n=1 Tax=Clostridium sp. TaxID=1506 RepID=UPI00284529C2|nr:hypothetical protein [Clostridium sp.]MDR3597082.1 hypothetical protein [Clostridium sp.]
MYKVLEENVMLRVENKWITTKVVLSSCSGGKRIDWVSEDGTIIKSEPHCRSKYSKVKDNK